MYKFSSIKMPEYLTQNRYKVVKSWKSTEWPQPAELKSQKYSAGTEDLPLRLIFFPFCSTNTGFRDLWSPKIRNAPNDSKLNLNTYLNSQKYSMYT